MKGHGEKLTRKREQAISALLTAPTVGDAAEVVGIGSSTLHRWLHEVEFRAAYLTARREIVGHTTAMLQQVSARAVVCLVEIMEHKENPPSSRVAAARAVLDLAYRGLEMEDLSARLDRLEGMRGVVPR